MTPISSLKVGDVISFETIAPGILPLKFNQVRFDGEVGWAVARSFGDIASLHRSLYPSMNQAEIKDDYRSYSYVLFVDAEGPNKGIPQVLGLPWIRADTVTVSGYEDLFMVFPNINPDRKQYLFQLLRANGFSNFQVTGKE